MALVDILVADSEINLIDPAQSYVNVKNFGAKGNGTTDDTLSIQSAINFAIAYNKGVVFFPVGNYKTTSALVVKKETNNSYNYVNLCLRGATPCKSAIPGMVSQITCTHKNTFAIGIQNGRGCVIENIYIKGKYDTNFSIANTIANDAQQWIDYGTTNGIRMERYSPYAGIVITPFGDTIPSDGGYPGFSSYYKGSAAGSSGCTVRNCHIESFFIPVLVGPNGTTSNDESFHIENCRIYDGFALTAYCQAQTRNCTIRDVDMSHCFFGITCSGFGYGSGSPPEVDNLLFVVGKNILNITLDRGNVGMRNIQAESFASIGVVGGSLGCYIENSIFKFNFGVSNSGVYPPAPDGCVVAIDGGIVTFRNCLFRRGTDNEDDFNMYSCLGNIIYDTCVFKGNRVPHSGREAARFINCKITSQGYDFGQGDKSYSIYNNEGRYIISSSSASSIQYSAFERHDLTANAVQQQLSSALTITVNPSNNTASFTLANAGGLLTKGDVLYSNTPGVSSWPSGINFGAGNKGIQQPYIGIVSSVVGTTVTISSVPFYVTTGTWGVSIKPTYMWAGGILGTITLGSNIITNIAYQQSTTPTRLIGAKISNSQFPAGTYITALDASTITLSNNATQSVSSAFIYSAFYNKKFNLDVIPSSKNGMFFDTGDVIDVIGSITKYVCSSPGIVGNSTHVPLFSTLN